MLNLVKLFFWTFSNNAAMMQLNTSTEQNNIKVKLSNVWKKKKELNSVVGERKKAILCHLFAPR